MVRYENGCVGCPPEMGCMGNACPYVNQRILECDECGQEVEELYEYEGRQVCDDCLLVLVPKVRE